MESCEPDYTATWMYNRHTPSLGYHIDVGGALRYLFNDDLNCMRVAVADVALGKEFYSGIMRCPKFEGALSLRMTASGPW